MKPAAITVKVTARVWLLREGEAFDYHSSYKQTTRLALTHSAALYRVGTKVVAAAPEEAVEGKLLAVVVLVRESAVLISAEAAGKDAPLWLVVREFQKKVKDGYRLCKSDVFRMGQTTWSVSDIGFGEDSCNLSVYDPSEREQATKKQLREIEIWRLSSPSPPQNLNTLAIDTCCSPQSVTQRESLDTQSPILRELEGSAILHHFELSSIEVNQSLNPLIVPIQEEEIGISAIHISEEDGNSRSVSEYVCKVCLSAEESPADPLVTPCKCKGSVQYMHVRCLHSWIASKQRCREDGRVKKYTWREALCGVCQQSLTSEVAAGGKVFTGLGVPRPKGQFMVLQRSDNEVQVWHWDDQNCLRAGSSPDSDIHVRDTEVSHDHARLKTKDGGVFLHDRNSKHGTLVLLQRPVLLPTKGLLVQTGNITLRIAVKRKRNFFSCFSASAPLHPSDAELEAAVVEVLQSLN